MKFLITYYGGKQKMLRHILPLIAALLLTACLPLKHTQPTRQSHVDSVFVQRLFSIVRSPAVDARENTSEISLCMLQ